MGPAGPWGVERIGRAGRVGLELGLGWAWLGCSVAGQDLCPARLASEAVAKRACVLPAERDVSQQSLL